MTQFSIPKTWLVFTIALTAYVILVLFFSSSPAMTITNGDEPHYLLQVHSLYYDRDFDTSNNYRNHDYRLFYDRETIEPHLHDFKGREVPYHFVLGTGLLLTLPYGLAGRIGVLLFTSLLLTFALVWLYRVVSTYTDEDVAWLTVLFCGLTYPLVIYSHQIYPETIAFVLVTFALVQIIVPKLHAQPARALLMGVTLGLLPHLHFKFTFLSIALYLFFLAKNRQKLFPTLVWSMGPILLLGIAFFAWTYHIHGELSRSVFLAPFQGEFGNGRLDGIFGLWFDQEYGLIFFAPVYLLAIFGAYFLVRNPTTRRDALMLGAIYVSYHLLCGSYYDWRGGLSATPRYLVPVLPILVIFVAKAVAMLWIQRQWLQPLGLALATVWITRLILFVHRPWMFGYSVGSNVILRDHYHWQWLIDRLPSFLAVDPIGAYGRLAGLLLILIVLWLLGIWINSLLWGKPAPVLGIANDQLVVRRDNPLRKDG